MVEHTNIMLCFLSSEQSEIDLALEYWCADSERRWKSTVQEIADRIGRPKHRVPELARRAAIAYNLHIRCADCHGPRVVSTRSDVMTYWACQGSNHYLCDDCRSARLEAKRLKEEEEKRIECERLCGIVQEVSDEDVVFDYAEIGYFDAVVAYSIMQWSDSAVATGLVGSPYQLALCPGNSLLSKLLGRLFDNGVLVFGRDTVPEAIDPETKNRQRLSYYPLKVSWQFAKPAGGGSFASVFRQIGSVVDLRADHPEYQDAVAELWWVLGEDEALRYLEQELNSYRLSEFVAGEKMKEAISYALNRFSIPKLRYLLYRIAKNVAALSSRRDFTRKHALNTIPGSLIRDCDRALADNWAIKPYCLKWDEEEARLVTVLFDRVLETGIEGFKSTTGATFAQAAA